jgi:N-acetylglucosaminyldiphosphoundecaprenol N-acetyl-beta-D-mannosaminyltransferase
LTEGREEFLGVPLDAIALGSVLDQADAAIAARQTLQHGSVNAAKVVGAQTDPQLREALWTFDVVTADGQAVAWAARLLGLPEVERVAGIDLMEALLARAAARGHRVFLLGARADVLEAATAELARRYPTLDLVGAQDGYFDRAEEDRVVGSIRASAPDLLFVALGTPEKELFLARHRDELGVPFAMGVGGALDVLAGRARRAPAWVQRMGFEWAFRLLQEPRRLARRYLVGNTEFVLLVAGELLRGRRRKELGR